MPSPPTPSWLALLQLPPGLDDTFQAWLIHYVATHLAPRDAHEDWLAARIAQAMARLHLSALREPEQIDPLWLRAETFADRQLRDARKAWNEHRNPVAPATRAAEANNPPPSAAPHPTPPTSPPPAPRQSFRPDRDRILGTLWSELAAFVDRPIGRPPTPPAPASAPAPQSLKTREKPGETPAC